MRLGDATLLVDDVRDALRVFILVARRGAVRESDLMFGIAEQREREIELLRELRVVLRRIETDAEDGGILRFVLRREVPEPGTLERSARCVGLRIKPKDDATAAEVGELHGVAFVIEDFKVGRFITGLQHRGTSGHRTESVSSHSAQRHAQVL
jgi:hypothetical protein